MVTAGPIVLPVVDTPPTRFVDHEAWTVTDDEAAEGNALGASIDVNDDEDDGGVRGGRHAG